jgi:hypothetical protein
MTTHLHLPSQRVRTATQWLGESLFVAGLLLVVVGLFFTAIGVTEALASPLLLSIAAMTGVLWFMRARWSARHPEEVAARHHQDRERRGF